MARRRGILPRVKVYVAGALADVEEVRAVQASVLAAGHDLALDWTRGPDAGVRDYASDPAVSAAIAADDLGAVLEADAVLVVVSGHEGRGMLVELGAALARAHQGDLEHVVVLGAVVRDSVFYHHPAVRRVSGVDEWLADLG